MFVIFNTGVNRAKTPVYIFASKQKPAIFVIIINKQ